MRIVMAAPTLELQRALPALLTLSIQLEPVYHVIHYALAALGLATLSAPLAILLHSWWMEPAPASRPVVAHNTNRVALAMVHLPGLFRLFL